MPLVFYLYLLLYESILRKQITVILNVKSWQCEMFLKFLLRKLWFVEIAVNVQVTVLPWHFLLEFLHSGYYTENKMSTLILEDYSLPRFTTLVPFIVSDKSKLSKFFYLFEQQSKMSMLGKKEKGRKKKREKGKRERKKKERER